MVKSDARRSPPRSPRSSLMTQALGASWATASARRRRAATTPTPITRPSGSPR